MNQEQIKDYTSRIAGASKTELTVITYELIALHIKEATDYYTNQEIALFRKSLDKAQKYLQSLMESLDTQYAISLELLSLYLYINKTLIEASIQGKPGALEGGIKVIDILRVGFEGVREKDQSGPVISNAQQVFAGLTYGKGTLNEVSLGAESRGFKA